MGTLLPGRMPGINMSLIIPLICRTSCYIYTCLDILRDAAGGGGGWGVRNIYSSPHPRAYLQREWGGQDFQAGIMLIVSSHCVLNAKNI